MDTQAPSLIPPSEGDKPFAFWHLVVDLTTLLQDWTRLRSDCQAHGLGPDYAKVAPLQERLDAILVKWGGTTPLLELKPLDQGGGESRAAFRHRRDQSLQQAWCTFCILAKRMMLQRPFISAAYRSAGKMEGMVRESVRSAVDLIQGARNIIEVFGPVPMRSTLPKHSLCQAAMDLILDFFFRPMRLEEDAGISQAQHSLHFVISLLKEDSMNYMPGSLLYDAGNKLEMLLELCARRYESQAKRTSQSYIMSQDESSEEAELDELDEQLKQFGRVIWFFGDTTARLDESSVHSADTIDFDLHTSSIPQPRRSTGNDWESVWHNLLGEVQLNAFF